MTHSQAGSKVVYDYRTLVMTNNSQSNKSREGRSGIYKHETETVKSKVRGDPPSLSSRSSSSVLEKTSLFPDKRV